MEIVLLALGIAFCVVASVMFGQLVRVKSITDRISPDSVLRFDEMQTIAGAVNIAILGVSVMTIGIFFITIYIIIR